MPKHWYFSLESPIWPFTSFLYCHVSDVHVKFCSLNYELKSKAVREHINVGDPCLACACNETYAAIRIATQEMPGNAVVPFSSKNNCSMFLISSRNGLSNLEKPIDDAEIGDSASDYELKRRLVAMEETTTLWHYSSLKIVCSNSGAGEAVYSMNCRSFLDLCWLCKDEKGVDFDLICVVWWRSWFKRNQLLFSNVVVHGDAITEWAMSFLPDFRNARRVEQTMRNDPAMVVF
ncbi:hypothetical protein QYF36_019901 [Acer negundo]|nr:hypothetical protein QYF36_019901 [Acer negundo]